LNAGAISVDAGTVGLHAALNPRFAYALSFANTSSDYLGSIREPRAKGVSQVRCGTFGILRRPTGRDPGDFAVATEIRQIARDRTRAR